MSLTWLWLCLALVSAEPEAAGKAPATKEDEPELIDWCWIDLRAPCTPERDAPECIGNVCCEDGYTCPSADVDQAEGCEPKRYTCKLWGWLQPQKQAESILP